MTDQLPALFGGFDEAAKTLGLERAAADDPVATRAAYRKTVREHPPDRDPEGFRRVRAAYELLLDPEAALLSALTLSHPHVPPPESPLLHPAPRGETALALLRVYAGQLDADALLGER